MYKHVLRQWNISVLLIFDNLFFSNKTIFSTDNWHIPLYLHLWKYFIFHLFLFSYGNPFNWESLTLFQILDFSAAWHTRLTCWYSLIFCENSVQLHCSVLHWFWAQPLHSYRIATKLFLGNNTSSAMLQASLLLTICNWWTY